MPPSLRKAECVLLQFPGGQGSCRCALKTWLLVSTVSPTSHPHNLHAKCALSLHVPSIWHKEQSQGQPVCYTPYIVHLLMPRFHCHRNAFLSNKGIMSSGVRQSWVLSRDVSHSGCKEKRRSYLEERYGTVGVRD